MTAAGAERVRRRFLLLRGLRWLPTGLLIPVWIVLLIERGLSLGQIGLVVAAQGVIVLLLELPTGGLADALGRRPILLVATLFDLTAVALLTVASSLPALAAVFALQGVYRALESGPLDAWYVDAARAADPDADLERGLSAGGVVLGVAVGVGTLLSGGLVTLGGVAGLDATVVPLLASVILRVVEFVAIATLMMEARPRRGLPALRSSLRAVPAVVADAIGLVRHSPVLLALVGVELLWGFGMVSFETFTPARLAAVLGDPDRAAALLGPANAAAWWASAAGAAAVPTVTRWLDASYAAALLRICQGLTVVGIALAAGPIGVLAAYLATMGVHGASNPLHQGLLHRAAPSSHRATVLSANSLSGGVGVTTGGIALGAFADATSLTLAILTGAGLLGAAAPLYLMSARRTRPVLEARG